MRRDLNYFAWLKEDMEARHAAGDAHATRWLEVFDECEQLLPEHRAACLRRLAALTPDDAAERIQARFTGADSSE